MLNEKRSEKVTDEEMDEMIEIVEVVCSITQVGVPVSKVEELIAAHCQTFLKMVKDPDRESYPAYPSSKSWCKAEAGQRSSEPITVIQYSAARSLRCPVLHHTQLQVTPSSHCSDRAENDRSPTGSIP